MRSLTVDEIDFIKSLLDEKAHVFGFLPWDDSCLVVK